jgi:hypothetical protein
MTLTRAGDPRAHAPIHGCEKGPSNGDSQLVFFLTRESPAFIESMHKVCLTKKCWDCQLAMLRTEA